MTISENLNDLSNKLIELKNKIVKNLNNKGVTSATTGNTLTEMADSINAIPASKLDWSKLGFQEESLACSIIYNEALTIKKEWKPQGSKRMYFTSKTNIIIPELDYSQTIDLINFAYNNKYIEHVGKMNCGQVADMTNMFFSCVALRKIDEIDMRSAVNVSNFLGNSGNANLRYVKLINLGTAQALKSVSILSKKFLQDGEGAEGCKQAFLDSILKYSFDRKSAGYADVTINLDPTAKAVLTPDEINQMKQRGYIIA